MFENIIFFGCGIGFAYLLKRMQDNQNNKFKSGEEDVCQSCKFRKVVINSIDEVETNGND